jgi:hypothetical protein
MNTRITSAFLAPVLVLGGCVIPATTSSLSGIALSGGALVALNEVNNNSAESEDRYRYTCEAEVEEVLWVLQKVIRQANQETLFASGPGDASADRSGNPKPPERSAPPHVVPRKQWTPVPYFEIDMRLSRANADSVVYVISHQRSSRVAVAVVAGRTAETVVVEFFPYEPETGAFLMLTTDESQRNAVEELHQRFYLTARELFGDAGLRRENPVVNRTLRSETSREGDSL